MSRLRSISGRFLFLALAAWLLAFQIPAYADAYDKWQKAMREGLHQSAQMYREPAPKISRGDFKSVIIDHGELKGTLAGNNGYYLFSEAGVGVQPLVLIGSPTSILQFLVDQRRAGIENRIKHLPDIYMGIVEYKPGQRFTGLFPFHDFVNKVANQVVGFGVAQVGQTYSGPGIATQAPKVPDIIKPNEPVPELKGTQDLLLEKLMGTQKWVSLEAGWKRYSLKMYQLLKKNPPKPKLYYVKFSYLQEKGMEKLGRGRVGFEQVLNEFSRHFERMLDKSS